MFELRGSVNKDVGPSAAKPATPSLLKILILIRSRMLDQ